VQPDILRGLTNQKRDLEVDITKKTDLKCEIEGRLKHLRATKSTALRVLDQRRGDQIRSSRVTWETRCMLGAAYEKSVKVT